MQGEIIMAYKKILTIQDISCVGQCSLTVALPILSACGLETCILPSAVLSTHTAGFNGFTFRDLTDDMPEIQAHWQKENIKFKAIYTGYLGSVKQVGYVQNILDTMGTDDCVRIVDPAMADNGKLYSIFNDEYVAAMRGLCKSADILIPNIAELHRIGAVEHLIFDGARCGVVVRECGIAILEVTLVADEEPAPRGLDVERLLQGVVPLHAACG